MFFHSHRRVQLYIWSNWPPKMTSRSSLLSKKEMYAASYIHRWGLWDVGRQRITQWQGHTVVWLAFLRRNVCKINISTNRWGKKLSLAKPRCRESVGTWDCPACRVLFIIQYFFFLYTASLTQNTWRQGFAPCWYPSPLLTEGVQFTQWHGSVWLWYKNPRLLVLPEPSVLSGW